MYKYIDVYRFKGVLSQQRKNQLKIVCESLYLKLFTVRFYPENIVGYFIVLQ